MIECFTTTFLRAHSWLNWVDEYDDEYVVGLKEKPEDTRFSMDGGMSVAGQDSVVCSGCFLPIPIVCRFGMPSVIHSDQGREFENKVMQELCLLCGSHKTRTTPCHPESDGLVERFNRTLLMMLAMFAGEKKDDWDDLLPAVMMAYHSSVHESTGFSPYPLMFGEECTLPMDIGLPQQDPEPPEAISNPFAIWVRDALEEAFDQVRRHLGQAVLRQKRLYDQRAVRRLFAIGDWVMRYYPPAKKCKLDSVWVGPYLVVSIVGWAVGIQKHPDLPVILIHCQDVKKVPQRSGTRSWIKTP